MRSNVSPEWHSGFASGGRVGDEGILDKEETGKLAARAKKEYILVYRVNEWLCAI